MTHIVVTGGSGFVGKALIQVLLDKGFFVRLVTRTPQNSPFSENAHVSTFSWNDLSSALEGSDAVINLVGAPIATRWTAKAKHRLWSSRVTLTKTLVKAMATLQNKPHTLISASAIGLFENSALRSVVESSPRGSGFLSDLCQAWEESAQEAEALGLRVVTIRMSPVLGDGGVLQKLTPLYRYFLGGHVGTGKQPFPWIHIQDLVSLFCFALDSPTLKGPLNAVAPEQVTMAEFGKRLGRALHRPSWLHVPEFALRIFLGEMAHSLCHGSYVESERLKEVGFQFQHPYLDVKMISISCGEKQ